MTESDMRKAARENLRGNWGISVGVTLVAALLGGMAMDITGGDTFRYILNYASNGRGELPALLRTILVPVLSGVGIWGASDLPGGRHRCAGSRGVPSPAVPGRAFDL